MDHRNGSRAPIAIPVELVRGDTSFGCFMSSNISHGGLLVNCSRPLKNADCLTVKIADDTSRSGYRHELKVMVVHNSESGVGLMWADYNVPFFNQLEIILSAAA